MMTHMPAWYEDDTFWETFGPSIFTAERTSQTAAEVGAIIALLQLKPGSMVLDLCCGPGRHSLEFARRGFLVTGVDRTSSYLEQARERTLSEHLSIEFLKSDMRSFVRQDTFDAALNFLTSFGYFEDPTDDFKVAQNLALSLKVGGKFLLEANGKEIVARNFQERRWRRNNDGTFLLEEARIGNGWDLVKMKWILAGDGMTKEFALSVRLYAASELIALLKRAGFREARAFGDVSGVPYDDKAKRLVVVALR
jgi:SAM-dependent methyltransferase